MKLKIKDQEIELPEFSIADYEDAAEELKVIHKATEHGYPVVQAAYIKLLVDFVKRYHSEIDEKDIKRAVPSRRVISLVNELLFEKKDAEAAQPSSA